MFLTELRYVLCDVETEFLYISGGQLNNRREAHCTRQFTK
jgi:hypothetical protein